MSYPPDPNLPTGPGYGAHPAQNDRFPPPANDGPPPVGPAYGPPAAAEVCAFHPDRPTGLRCTRCGRPACPDCLTPASVGFQCKACIAEARGTARTASTIAGSRLNQQPLVTGVLIAVNLVVFVITSVQARSVTSPSGSAVFEQGAEAPDLVAAGQFWRLFSSGFLHLSLIHIALNMISLYVLGNPLERILGRGRFLVAYLLAMLGGSVAVLLFAQPQSLSAGASGAIFGLMGALVVTFRRLRLDPRQLVSIVVLNLIISFTIPGISWQDHIGGLVVGAVAGAIMVYPPMKVRRSWQIGGSLGLLGLLIMVVVIFSVAHTAVYCSISGEYLIHC